MFKFKKKILFWEGIKGLTDLFPPYFLREGKSELEKNLQNLYDPYSIVLPLWYDIYCDILNQKVYYGKTACYDITNNTTLHNNTPLTKQFNISIHGNSQFLDFLPRDCSYNDSVILKLNSPWFFKTLPGYNLLQLPINLTDEHYQVIPGVTWQDIYFDTNTQVWIKTKKNFFLSMGTPISLLVPYKREKFKLKKLNKN